VEGDEQPGEQAVVVEQEEAQGEEASPHHNHYPEVVQLRGSRGGEGGRKGRLLGERGDAGGAYLGPDRELLGAVAEVQVEERAAEVADGCACRCEVEGEGGWC
jgi:hypothetical protein